MDHDQDHDQDNRERFDALAPQWDSDPQHVFMAQKIARAMRQALNPQGHERALEFGAGTGLATLLMARSVAHITAMDASGGMLAVLSDKCRLKGLEQVEILQGQVPEQLPDAEFDLIYSSMTLHHIQDVPGLLAALFQRLKPGGQLALADLDKEDGSFHSDHSGVAHRGFERELVGQWLAEAGLVDAEFSTAFTVQRLDEEGQERQFPIFLVTARRPQA